MDTLELQTRIEAHALDDLHVDVAGLARSDWRTLPGHLVGPLERACGFALVTSATHPSMFVLLYCPELLAELVAHDDSAVSEELVCLVELVVDLNIAFAPVVDADARRDCVEMEIDACNSGLLGVLSAIQMLALDRWQAGE